MIKVLIQHDRSFYPQIEYIFYTFFSILGIEYEFIESLEGLNMDLNDILVIYHNDPFDFYDDNVPNILLIKSTTKLFGQNYLTENSVPLTAQRFSYEGNDLMSLYSDDQPLHVKVTTSEHQKITMTNLDFISDSFFMLTRYEEVVKRKVSITDFHSRFPVRESVAFKASFLNRPIVNESIDFLWVMIKNFSLGYMKRNLWGNKKFAACISHDVDYVRSGFKDNILHSANLLLNYKKHEKALATLTGYWNDDPTHNPAWTFDNITEKEKSLGFTSSFYFMAGGTSSLENFYTISDPYVLELIQDLEEKGCEVGYHASYNSFNDAHQMAQEIHSLDKVIKKRPYGCRQHYLRFQAPETWRNQEKCGLLYDTTLTFPDVEGFRSGICLPYKPFDLLENRVLNLWEIPLTVMDGTLKDYRKLSPEEALITSIHLIKTVQKHQGVFSLLWHNTSLNGSWKGWAYVLDGIMNFLHQENCLGVNGRTIIEILSKK